MFIGEISRNSSLQQKAEFFTYILTSDILNDKDSEHKFFNLLYLITEGAPSLDFNSKFCIIKNREELLMIKILVKENDSLDFCRRHIIANYLVGLTKFNNKQAFRVNDIHTTYSILLNYLSLQHISNMLSSIERSDLYRVYEKLLANDIGGFDLATFNNISKNTNTYITNPIGYFEEVACTHQLTF